MTPDRHVLDTTTGPETLDAIQGVLDEVWREHDVPEIVRIHMDLAAGEIGANIIEHSGGGRPVRLRMEVRMRPDAVEAVFNDDGKPARIDLAGAGLPEEFAERGRGLAMAHRVLDELSYRRDEQGNHWTLVRKRTMDG
ncbi:ATP-binding protein [Mycobacterium sp. 1274761.0]|uniref:ATP-binding protein n=1 Tax=Mycobacterium sp. 1274761.0 TaxID=1834077 RepID=UPI0007FE03FA|nr:ATP-binding protein [Mycobacterium sp. 1274761.0]OBK71973.1 anti-sigma regulatory factor [Mycobacterium sp. 1274761.0]